MWRGGGVEQIDEEIVFREGGLMDVDTKENVNM